MSINGRFTSFIILLLLSVNCLAKCINVYTIGAYDDAFAHDAKITKLGPLAAQEVPPTIPRSFLEKNGSYGGGEAFCKIKEACQALSRQLEAGILPAQESWHIYLLDATWNKDTYKLHPNDFRISHSVAVIKKVKESCNETKEQP